MSYPNWLAGFGITTIQVTAQQFSGGVLVTPAGQFPVDFFTVVDRIFYQHEVEHRNVTPTNSRQRNLVILETGGTFTITELMRAEASALGGAHAFNSLAALFHTYDYFKLVFTRAMRSYTDYAVNGGYDEDVGRTRGVSVARFMPTGIIAAGGATTRNPAYL
jgi:hypothetical protein